MIIGTVLFDQAKSAAVVTLVEEGGERVLPIFIGLWEGTAIFRELNRTPSPRPLLHDLFGNVLQGLHVRLEKIVIDALSDATYYVQMHLQQQDATIIADARPSDAIALAVKLQAPIYVAEAVLEAAGKRGDFTMEPEEKRPSTPSKEDVQAWLENLRPEDFADPR
jgi:hypothetical protein